MVAAAQASALAGPGPRRPRRRHPLLRRPRRRGRDARVLVAGGRPGGGARPHGDRARHRLPPRPWPRDPARHRHLHLARRPERPPRQGPHRARAGRELDVVIFDKTGTLTKGQPALAAVSAAGGPTSRGAAARGLGRGRLRASTRPGDRRAPRERGSRSPRRRVRGPRRPRRPGHGRRARCTSAGRACSPSSA